MRLSLFVLAAVVLAGCVTPVPMAPAPEPSRPVLPKPNEPNPVMPMPGDPALASCGATDLQSLVGLSERVLPPDGRWSVLRVIRPGQMVTMDYSPTRLNVEVDDGGTIMRLSCG